MRRGLAIRACHSEVTGGGKKVHLDEKYQERTVNSGTFPEKADDCTRLLREGPSILTSSKAKRTERSLLWKENPKKEENVGHDSGGNNLQGKSTKATDHATQKPMDYTFSSRWTTFALTKRTRKQETDNSPERLSPKKGKPADSQTRLFRKKRS